MYQKVNTFLLIILLCYIYIIHVTNNKKQKCNKTQIKLKRRFLHQSDLAPPFVYCLDNISIKEKKSLGPSITIYNIAPPLYQTNHGLHCCDISS